MVSAAYDDLRLPALPGLDKELAVLTAWLCSEELSPDRHFTPAHTDLARNPTSGEVRTLMSADHEWSPDDAGVVFVTGHGVRKHGRHWLAFRDTRLDNVFGTAVETAQFVGAMATRSYDNLLVIVDACYSGATGEATIAFDTPIPEHCLVLASAGANQPAYVGTLTGVIGEILAELRSDAPSPFGDQPYLREDHFFTEVNERLKAHGQHLVPLGHRLLTARPNRCLPNPRHRPDTVQPSRRDLAIRADDLAAHWDPRSRGVVSAGELGWLFTGRADLMRQLIAAASGPAGTTVVTGRAGCGKSAVLSRLVTLSDPGFIDNHAMQVAVIPDDLKPSPNAVDVAVLATGKLSADIFAQVLYALDIPLAASVGTVPSLADMRTAWATRPSKDTGLVTVVVDAVDEAADPGSLIDDVLTSLAADGGIRLIIGVRAPSPDEPRPEPPTAALSDLIAERLAATRLQIDRPPLWRVDDLADYVAQTLTQADHSPYRHLVVDKLAEVARRIAADAGSSFLIARLAASQLATRPEMVDMDSAAWQHAIRAGVVGMFGENLRTSLGQDDRERVVDLLRAVAFAFGRGLPWYQIWPRVANAVSLNGRAYGDADIRWLLQSPLSGYLVTDTEDDATVYRLFHDELRTALRVHAHELLQAQP
ncbi:hypothetical protein GCM10009682_23750 [Luedemannella flava]|uniref:ATP-binding protein n=2 Tax=Luedemannella flava TaxID=349316 RepID=A0ABN2LWF6_9ACTN